MSTAVQSTAVQSTAAESTAAQDVPAHTRPDAADGVVWRTPVQGLWVAETPNDYLGMVDRSHEGFVATGASGQDLGVYPTREEAQRAVAARWFAGTKPLSLAGRILPLVWAAVAIALPEVVIGVVAVAVASAT